MGKGESQNLGVLRPRVIPICSRETNSATVVITQYGAAHRRNPSDTPEKSLAVLVHLARASSERSIKRNGIAGKGCRIETDDGSLVLKHAVYAMPMMRDFAITYQWMRELRQWHGQRMVAARFRLLDKELVFVGRFGKPHKLCPLSLAVAWVQDHPAGAEIIVPRSVASREIKAVLDVPQLVGWVRTPENPERPQCVCRTCLPSGIPNAMRRIKAAYERLVAIAGNARTPAEIAEALSAMQTPLERARNTLSPRKILRFSNSDSEPVRRSLAWLLGYFDFRDIKEALYQLVDDHSRSVREYAIDSLCRVVGLERALKFLEPMPLRTLVQFIDQLQLLTDEQEMERCLLRLARHPEPAVRVHVAQVRSAINHDFSPAGNRRKDAPKQPS